MFIRQTKELFFVFRALKQAELDKGYTKIQITIEKDRSVRENKKRNLDYWRNFERTREQHNQQKKLERIDAMREKKTNYPQLKEENARQVNAVSNQFSSW